MLTCANDAHIGLFSWVSQIENVSTIGKSKTTRDTKIIKWKKTFPILFVYKKI